jgi:beta-galactosidase/beta-glucuronidase
MSVPIPARKSGKVKTLDLQAEVKKQGAHGLLTWLKLEVDGKTVSENLVLLALPKELKLSDPKLASSVKESGDGFLVTIQSATPALWVWLELKNADAKYTDNFIHLMPSAPQTILVQPKQLMSREAFLGELQVRSLYDTYSPG